MLSSTGRWASTESRWDGDDTKRYCYRVWGTCDTSQRRGDILTLTCRQDYTENRIDWLRSFLSQA